MLDSLRTGWDGPEFAVAGLAALALVVSLLALRYTYVQARASKRATEIEDERAHRERKPTIDLSFDGWLSATDLTDLVVTSESGIDVAVTIELVDGPPLAGFGVDAPRRRTFSIPRLAAGRSEKMPFSVVAVRSWPAKKARFVVRASDGGRPWEADIKDVPLPYEPMKIHAPGARRITDRN